MNQYMNDAVDYARSTADNIGPVQGFTERHCDRLAKTVSLAREIETMVSSLNERMFGPVPTNQSANANAAVPTSGRADQMDRLLDELNLVMSRLQDEAARANSRI